MLYQRTSQACSFMMMRLVGEHDYNVNSSIKHMTTLYKLTYKANPRTRILNLLRPSGSRRITSSSADTSAKQQRTGRGIHAPFRSTNECGIM